MKNIFFPLLFICSIGAAQTDLTILKQKTDSCNFLQSQKYSTAPSFGKSRNPLKLIPNSLLWIYQKIFSQQIMAECGFEPSCSSFAKQAIRERGIFVGIFLATDRLTRCNGVAQLESETYLVNEKTGKLRDEPSMYKVTK
jgi:putative component of membrane protein insertase Oxa1/YidC/SpoIIIJ protein YidD